MIRIGICSPMDAFETVAQMGFDYMETGLVPLYRLSDEDFSRMCERVDRAPIRIEAFNGMLPGTLPVTGPNVDGGALDEYLEKIVCPCAQTGCGGRRVWKRRGAKRACGLSHRRSVATAV